MRKLLLILLCLTSVNGFSQIKAFRDTVKNGYNFWLYNPVSSDSVERPLIIFLHGNSLCGSDLNRVRRYGCIDAVQKGMKIDAYIIAPQNPGGAWKPSRVKNIVDWVQTNYAVDTNRVYVVGMSLGGYGTLDYAGTYSSSVAAAVALCGGSTLKNVDSLARVPLWIMHGTADRAVSIKESKRVVDALKSKGDTSLLRFDAMAGLSHSALARVFYLPELYDWLFSHSRADTTFSTQQVINSTTLKQAYASIDKSAAKPQIIDAGSFVGGKAQATTTSGKIHIIKKGDTLSAIAKRYGTSVSKLCQNNSISAKSILRLGQKISL